MEFLILLDIDKNASTGAAAFLGADYVIDLVSRRSVDLFHWNGSDYVRAASQASLVYSYAATGPLIRVSAADLGKPKILQLRRESPSPEKRSTRKGILMARTCTATSRPIRATA